jgi:hypothetical protein
LTAGQVVAGDGKALRRSHDHSEGKKALQIVSLWASENGVVLGQRKVDEESIENKVHWVLDIAFREDDCRIRAGNGAENFAPTCRSEPAQTREFGEAQPESLAQESCLG